MPPTPMRSPSWYLSLNRATNDTAVVRSPEPRGRRGQGVRRIGHSGLTTETGLRIMEEDVRICSSDRPDVRHRRSTMEQKSANIAGPVRAEADLMPTNNDALKNSLDALLTILIRELLDAN